MNKFLYLLLLLLSISANIYAQIYEEHCATDHLLHETLERDPSAATRLEQMNADIETYLQNAANRAERNIIVTIPVTFHIIHNGQSLGNGLNISDAQIQSQIAVLNECYRKRNADTALVPNIFKSRIADIEVEFCLATTDPSGNPTNGITRHNFTTVTDFDNSIKPTTQWDPTKYLNFWTTALGGTLLGYATMPGIGPANQDGVVLDYRYVGAAPANPFTSNYVLGKTAVHEVGHWLGLFHTFQDSCSGTSASDCALLGDKVCDTPPTRQPNFGNPSLLQNSCTETPVDEPDMWMNYMDYVNDVNLQMFSTGQRDRMRAVLNGQRISLQSSAGCNSGNTFSYSGLVVDDQTNAPVPNAKVFFDGVSDFETTADANGTFNISVLHEGNYDVYAGKWGYLTRLFSINTFFDFNSAAITIPIQNHHYYDDFIMNYSWSTNNTGATAGLWIRAQPSGTFDQTVAANPGLDLPDDLGLSCFVTGNNGTTVNNDDVDAGTVTLLSPVMDLTGYTDPYLRYSRWYYDGQFQGSVPDDILVVKMNNGTSTATVETVQGTEGNTNSWIQKVYRVADVLPITNNMRFIIEASDPSSGNTNIVEAGLDRFEVLEGASLSVADVGVNELDITVSPNPGRGIFNIQFNAAIKDALKLSVVNVLGEIIYSTDIASSTTAQQINIGNQTAGIYFLNIKSETGEKTVRVSLIK